MYQRYFISKISEIFEKSRKKHGNHLFGSSDRQYSRLGVVVQLLSLYTMVDASFSNILRIVYVYVEFVVDISVKQRNIRKDIYW